MSIPTELIYHPANPGKAPPVPNFPPQSILINGEIRDITGEPGVTVEPIISPVQERKPDGSVGPVEIGVYTFATEEMGLEAVRAAHKAYGAGTGAWARATPRDRIAAVEKFCTGLQGLREVIAGALMWEISKNSADAFKEVDRTVEYIQATVKELKRLENASIPAVHEQGILAQIKRSPLGVALCCAPFNYPLNETYTTLIPALIMGNTVILKVPRVGGLCHLPTLELFRDCFPPGVVNVVTGSGRALLGPIMKTGLVNILAFIGTHRAANAILISHPRPFAVRLALGLDAKNPAFILPDADLDIAATECALGSLSYCGQRCTAIKMIFAHESVASAFAEKLVAKVAKLRCGFPWDGADITPLPEPAKPAYIATIVADAVAKGAKVINPHGGDVVNQTLVVPAILFPVDLTMRVAHEEQFGPAVPIATYKDVAELERYMTENTEYGQQASVFTTSSTSATSLIDFLAHHVTRININAQCQRGPDVLPFSGRKCSATGTLSVSDALRTMSIRVAVATKDRAENVEIFSDAFMARTSNVLRADLLL